MGFAAVGAVDRAAVLIRADRFVAVGFDEGDGVATGQAVAVLGEWVRRQVEVAEGVLVDVFLQETPGPSRT